MATGDGTAASESAAISVENVGILTSRTSDKLHGRAASPHRKPPRPGPRQNSIGNVVVRSAASVAAGDVSRSRFNAGSRPLSLQGPTSPFPCMQQGIGQARFWTHSRGLRRRPCR